MIGDTLAVCLVCGMLEDCDLKKAMNKGWVFAKCPECQRGTPIDILATYLAKTTNEIFLEGFCERHWFKDTGICGYCKMRRQGVMQDVS